MWRSYVDLLFILLCSALVLLSRSMPVDVVRGAPATSARGDVSPSPARVAWVGVDHVWVGNERYDDLDSLRSLAATPEPVVLLPRDGSVSHQRVLDVWSTLREAGRPVMLGVRRAEPEPEPGDNGPEASR